MRQRVAFAETSASRRIDQDGLHTFIHRGTRQLDLPHRLAGWVVVSEDDHGNTYRETGVYYPGEYKYAVDDCESMHRRLRPRNTVKVMALVEVTTELIRQGEEIGKEED